jgi:hypothetical protein
MKEQFDKKLAKKIADTFSRHEEPFDQKEWEKLSKVYFPKTEKIFPWKWIFISSGIAAAILVVFLLLPELPTDNTNPQLAISTQSSERDQANPENEKAADATVQESQTEEDANAITSKERRESKKQEVVNALPDKPAIPTREKLDPKIDTPITSHYESQALAANQTLAEKIEVSEDADKSKAEKSEAMQQAFALTPTPLLPDEPSAAIAAVKKWLEEGNEEKPEIKKEKNIDPFRLGVMVAPQTISNATQTFNLGAGIMSEFAFSKRLKLDVGVAYARQNINPESSGRGDYIVAQSADYQQVRMSSMSSNFITSSNRLSFGQVEVPVNLKYRILENKSSGWYLMSGLSNMMYINQQQITTYSTANFGVANFGIAATPQVQTFESVTTPSADQGSMNVGQLVNLGFGFEQNLKNGTFVYIEPFYKFSLGSQTFAEQQFSIGGINLRMNFQIKK